MLDSIVSADAGTARVTRRAEPMVLGGARRACTPASVGSSIDCVAEDVVCEDRVIRNDSRCQVMRDAFTDIEDSLDLSVAILSHDLERSEELSREQLSLPLTAEVLERYEDASGLPRAIFSRDLMVLQGCASENYLSAI